ncbi:MAG: helix-turn-helix transcriptional regulator [Thiobacillaceae bacterium]|nr:helix-turn-helix transcriptional regulator [Thiobacillaceae bacterium]
MVVLELYRASREVPFQNFQEHALLTVKARVPFDSAWWGMSSPRSIQRPHLHHCDARIVEDYQSLLDRDFFRAALIDQPGKTINLADLVSRARYLRTPLYRQLGRRYGMEWMLGTLLVEPVSGLYEIVTLWRHGARRPFTEDERRIKERLMPHLAEAYRINRLIHLLGESRPMPMAWALLDEHGHLRELSPAFVHLLREEWPGWRGDRLPETFPSPARLRASRTMAWRTVSVSVAERGGFLFLTARRASAIDKLGAREREVALRYARGQTHAAIATALGIAPGTVRNHIARCYKHLAVNNKVELSRRLQDDLP